MLLMFLFSAVGVVRCAPPKHTAFAFHTSFGPHPDIRRMSTFEAAPVAPVAAPQPPSPIPFMGLTRDDLLAMHERNAQMWESSETRQALDQAGAALFKTLGNLANSASTLVSMIGSQIISSGASMLRQNQIQGSSQQRNGLLPDIGAFFSKNKVFSAGGRPSSAEGAVATSATKTQASGPVKSDSGSKDLDLFSPEFDSLFADAAAAPAAPAAAKAASSGGSSNNVDLFSPEFDSLFADS